MKTTSVVLMAAGLLLVVSCTGAALIQPRPVDNRRDPHDGEPFEWEPVDDDPWPGPSFTFPAGLPGIDEVGSLVGSRPATLAETRVRASLLMQLLRTVFNNNNGGGAGGNTKPVSSNEVPGPSWQQQRLDKRSDRNHRPAN